MRISDWSSDVCSSDLNARQVARVAGHLDVTLAGRDYVNRRRSSARTESEALRSEQFAQLLFHILGKIGDIAQHFHKFWLDQLNIHRAPQEMQVYFATATILYPHARPLVGNKGGQPHLV